MVRKYEEYVTLSFGCESLCNPGGSGLMQHLQDDLDTKFWNQEAKHSAQIANLEAQVSLLLLFKNYILDVCERAFLTYLRNY